MRRNEAKSLPPESSIMSIVIIQQEGLDKAIRELEEYVATLGVLAPLKTEAAVIENTFKSIWGGMSKALAERASRVARIHVSLVNIIEKQPSIDD